MLRFLMSIALIILPVGCQIVAKRPDKKTAKDSARSENINEKANDTVEEIQIVFSTLTKLTSPLDSQINSSLPTPESEKSTINYGLVANEKKQFSSVFSLCSDLFSEIGVGNLEASSTTGVYSQEFESLSARKITNGTARVYLVLRGLSGNSDRSESFEIAIKISDDSGEKQFTLYRKGDLSSYSSQNIEQYEGYSPNLVLSLEALEQFYDSMAEHADLKRKLKVSGSLMTLNGKDGLRRLVSSSLKWQTTKYQFLVNTLDAISRGEGEFKDIMVDANILNNDQMNIGVLKIDAANLDSKEQSLSADIRYNSTDGI